MAEHNGTHITMLSTKVDHNHPVMLSGIVQEESGGGSAVEPDGTGCLPAMRHEEAMRLDAMMDRVFGYMHSACYVKGAMKWMSVICW